MTEESSPVFRFAHVRSMGEREYPRFPLWNSTAFEVADENCQKMTTALLSSKHIPEEKVKINQSLIAIYQRKAFIAHNRYKATMIRKIKQRTK